MANTLEMAKITISTRNFEDVDALKQPVGTFKGILKDLNTDLNSFERVLQSATNYFDFFNSSLKKIDPQTGLAQQSFFIRKEELGNALKALESKSSEMAVKRGSDYAFDVSDIEVKTGRRKIYGKKAQQKAIEEINKIGGTATVDTKNPDMMRITVPFEQSAIAGKTNREIAYMINSYIPEATKLSNIERNRRKTSDKEREEKEKEREEAKEIKERKDSIRKATTIGKAILATLILVADIVRRILTASLRQASENDRMAVETHAVGMTMQQRRNMDMFDMAHGMEKGATFAGVQAVQGMFGDITNLDEKALGTLARVMGSGISNMVTSGMGGENPDKLLDNILNAYFKQFLAGKNSLGQNVGMEQARRELVQSLKSVSPEIAQLFARMAEDYTSGAYGKFSNIEEYRNTTIVNRTGLSEADLKYSAEIGKKYDEIIAIFDNLKVSFLTRLANSCDGLLNNIKGLHIGDSATTIIEEDKKNKQKTQQSKAVLEKQLAMYEDVAGARARKLGSLEATPIGLEHGVFGDTQKYSSEQAKYFRYSIKDLASIMSGNYSETEIARRWGKEHVQAYIERGKDIAKNALFDTEIQDELARAIAVMTRLKEIEKNEPYAIGSGKVKDLSMTEAQLTWKAQEIIEKNNKDLGWKMSEKVRYEELGSQAKDSLFNAVMENFLINPAEFNRAVDFQMKHVSGFGEKYGKERRRIAEQRAGRKLGVHEDIKLSKEDEIRAYINAMGLKWFYQLDDTAFIPYFALDKAKENINKGDSKVLSKLIESGYSFEKNKTYSLSGAQGQGGEYILRIQTMDKNGQLKDVGSLNWSDFQGVIGNVGNVYVDEKGNLQYSTIQ
jgi:hypothetical protein